MSATDSDSSEKVAALARNGWPSCSGFGGRHGSELMAVLFRIMQLGEASREYKIKDSVISGWRNEFIERAPQVFEQTGDKDSQAQQIAELERTHGRVTMQLEIAKNVFGDSDFLSKGGGDHMPLWLM